MITQLISCDVSPTRSCGHCSAFMDVKLGQGSSGKEKKKNKIFICPLFEFHAPVVDRHLHQVSFEILVEWFEILVACSSDWNPLQPGAGC